MNVLRLKAVKAKIGLCRSTIYDRMNQSSPRFDPSFPRPIPLGNSKNPPVGWLESSLDKWISDQAKKNQSPSSSELK